MWLLITVVIIIIYTLINDIIIAMMIKEVGIGEYRWIARADIPEDEKMLNHNCHEISDWAWQVL